MKITLNIGQMPTSALQSPVSWHGITLKSKSDEIVIHNHVRLYIWSSLRYYVLSNSLPVGPYPAQTVVRNFGAKPGVHDGYLVSVVGFTSAKSWTTISMASKMALVNNIRDIVRKARQLSRDPATLNGLLKSGLNH